MVDGGRGLQYSEYFFVVVFEVVMGVALLSL